MGLFKDLGRKAEKFKQSATEAAEEVRNDPDYRCRSCDAGVSGDHETCPECGADAIDPVGDDDTDDG